MHTNWYTIRCADCGNLIGVSYEDHALATAIYCFLCAHNRVDIAEFCGVKKHPDITSLYESTENIEHDAQAIRATVVRVISVINTPIEKQKPLDSKPEIDYNTALEALFATETKAN